jgi:transposase
MLMAYESLFCRFTRAGAGGSGPWNASRGGGQHLRRQSREPQALARCSARHRRLRATTSNWGLGADAHLGPRRRGAGTGGRLSRCDLGRARCSLECRSQHLHQPVDDGPSLRPGQVVLLDNLSAHKSPRLRKLLAARGCRLWYLPSYSPDFSPIELAIAKVKAELRRVGARTREALEAAVAQALKHVSSDDARAFFTHCGFRFCPDLAQWFCP